MAVTILFEEAVTLFIKLQADLRNSTLIWSVGYSIPTFVVFMPIRRSWQRLDQNYDVLVCAESEVSDRHQLSELRIPGFGCPQPRLRNSTPSAHGMALYDREGFRSVRQSKLECSYRESCVLRICSRIKNLYVCQNPCMA